MDEEETVFHANICFVCNLTARETRLKHCGSCKMISYCSEAHQKKHWKKHKKLCGVIQKVDKMLKPDDLEDKLNWYKYRTNFMMLCELEMGRKLKSYEMNMILFPNRCQICHSKNVSENCQDCFCVSYCSKEHKDADSSFHASICQSLALCLKVDLYLQSTHYYPSYDLCEGDMTLPGKMEQFISSSVEISSRDTNSRQVEEALVSELITCPLSLLIGLNWINFTIKDDLCVHVVGSGLLETASLKSWEAIPHIFKQVKKLSIFFIGPESTRNDDELCESCNDIIEFKFIDDLYHNFVKSNEYKKPDVICAFNCGFHEYENSDSDTWSESLPLLIENSPLIITSFTEDEADRDLAKLLKINDKLKNKKSENPFSSLRPYRDLENMGIYYNNKFLSTILSDS